MHFVRSRRLASVFSWRCCAQPPSPEALEARLRGRGTETEDKIQKRLRNAVSELEQSKSLHFDHRLVNKDLESAKQQFESFVRPVRCKCADYRLAQSHAQK